MNRNSEALACDPSPIDPNGFNPQTMLPFGPRIEQTGIEVTVVTEVTQEARGLLVASP